MKVVLITFFATLFIQLGFFLWKLSAEGQPKIGSAPIKKVMLALFTDWRWVLGLIFTNIGWVLFLLATTLGEISLVQPLMSAGDFLLVIMAVVFLKERLNKSEWAGVIITVIGAILLSSEAGESHTITYSRINLGLMIGVLGLSAGGFIFLSRKVKNFGPEFFLALAVGLCFGMGSILAKAMTVPFFRPQEAPLFFKSWALLFNPLLPMVILANVLGMILLQAAFQRGRAAVIVPLQLAILSTVTVFAGAVIFSEQVSFLRVIAILLILLGAAFLQKK